MYTNKISIAIIVVCMSFLGQSTTQADLVHHYSFEIDGRDTVGGAHALLLNGASIVNGAVDLDGVNDYVSMPAVGSTMENLGSEVTIEAWFESTPLNSDDYYRVFDLGSGFGEYIAMTPRDHINQNRFFLRDTNGADEQHTFSAGYGEPMNHLVLTIENNLAKLYVNNSLKVSTATAFSPSNLGFTTQNWLGRSRYPADPYLHGSIGEFNIYTHALSAQQVNDNYLRGTGVPEPSSFAVTALVASFLIRRRRRK